jgi:hypothetical protein
MDISLAINVRVGGRAEGSQNRQTVKQGLMSYVGIKPRIAVLAKASSQSVRVEVWSHGHFPLVSTALSTPTLTSITTPAACIRQNLPSASSSLRMATET